MLAQARRINHQAHYLVGYLRSTRLGRTFDAVLIQDAIAYIRTMRGLSDCGGAPPPRRSAHYHAR
ncbi:MAG: hypothetical protein ACKVVP_14295 [Chloroflexota bacterium]